MGRLLAMVAAACALLAGCGDDGKDRAFAPVPFGPHDRCILCGMVIQHYEGPKAEVFVKGAEDEAAKFCSGRDAFTFALQPENSRRLRAFYIHDMGATPWEKPDDAALIDATRAVYVYGHDIDGVMGPEPAAFSSEAKARAFLEKHGGALLRYSDITLERLER